jgi:hypothetical protein
MEEKEPGEIHDVYLVSVVHGDNVKSRTRKEDRRRRNKRKVEALNKSLTVIIIAGKVIAGKILCLFDNGHSKKILLALVISFRDC